MKTISENCAGPARERTNQARFLRWTVAWALSFLLVVYGLKTGWLATGLLGVLAAVVPTALGVGTALAYTKFLREADELRRAIEMQGLALAYAVGVVGGLTYLLLERAEVVANAEVANLVVVMMFAHPLGSLIARRRYT